MFVNDMDLENQDWTVEEDSNIQQKLSNRLPMKFLLNTN